MDSAFTLTERSIRRLKWCYETKKLQTKTFRFENGSRGWFCCCFSFVCVCFGGFLFCFFLLCFVIVVVVFSCEKGVGRRRGLSQTAQDSRSVSAPSNDNIHLFPVVQREYMFEMITDQDSGVVSCRATLLE